MTFQQIVLALQKFWSKQGCVLGEAYDTEKGAGTMNPATFLRTIGPGTVERSLYGSIPAVRMTAVMGITRTVSTSTISSRSS